MKKGLPLPPFDHLFQAIAIPGGGADGIAEAYYKEIPEEIVKEIWSRLPETLREILREMERDWGYPLKGNVG